jgi:hypothetical protein
VDQDIIDAQEANTMTMHDFVTPQQLLSYFSPVYEQYSCTFDTDYDGDTIANHLDVCPLTYDPFQHDTDDDGLGNVCDGDIDNDGHSNPVGLVDFTNTINPRLREDT